MYFITLVMLKNHSTLNFYTESIHVKIYKYVTVSYFDDFTTTYKYKYLYFIDTHSIVTFLFVTYKNIYN